MLLLLQQLTDDLGYVSALMAYDYEFLLPNFTTPPTVFQD